MRKEISALMDGMADAWARGDAHAFASYFTEDATYTTFVGTVYKGRSDIERSHDELFKRFLQHTRLAGEITSVRQIGPDVVVVTGRGDVYRKQAPKKLSKVQTYTVLREADGRWRVTAFHNTQRKSLMEAISFKFAPRTMPS